MHGLRLSLGVEPRTILAQWIHRDVISAALDGYLVTSQIVGVGDCDSDYDGPSSSVVVDDTTTTRLIVDVRPWRRYGVTVTSLYHGGRQAHAFAEISSIETGQHTIRYSIEYLTCTQKN